MRTGWTLITLALCFVLGACAPTIYKVGRGFEGEVVDTGGMRTEGELSTKERDSDRESARVASRIKELHREIRRLRLEMRLIEEQREEIN